MSASFAGSGSPLSAVRDEAIAGRGAGAAGDGRIPLTGRRERRLQRHLARTGCGVRGAAPSIAASWPRPSRARRRSSTPARASRLRQTSPRKPAALTSGPVPNVGGAPGVAGAAGAAACCCGFRHAADAPNTPRTVGAVIRNCLRVFMTIHFLRVPGFPGSLVPVFRTREPRTREPANPRTREPANP